MLYDKKGRVQVLLYGTMYLYNLQKLELLFPFFFQKIPLQIILVLNQVVDLILGLRLLPEPMFEPHTVSAWRVSKLS